MEPEGVQQALRASGSGIPAPDAPPIGAALGRTTPASQLRSLIRPLRVRDYRLLWLAQVFSELGDWATRLALMLLVYHRTHSAAWSAAVVTVSLLPWVGLGQVLTTMVDHLPRRTVMIGADIARAAVFGVMVIPLPIAAVFVGAFVAGLGTAPFESARHAIRVEVTEDQGLYGGALTLFAITGQVTTTVGFAIGGAMVSLVGARATFAVNAVSFLASAAFVLRLSTRSSGRAERSNRQAYLAAAIRFLLRDPVVRWCSTLSMTTAFAGMGIEAIAAPYGHGHAGQVTLLAVAVPVGTVAAAAVVPHTGPPRRLLRAAGLLPVVGGIAGLVIFGVGHGYVLGALGFAASGVAVAVPAPAGPIVGRRLHTAVRAPAFSVLQGATLGCMAAGAAVGGVLAAIFGPVPTAIAASGAMALVGIAASVRLPDPATPAMVPAVPSAA